MNGFSELCACSGRILGSGRYRCYEDQVAGGEGRVLRGHCRNRAESPAEVRHKSDGITAHRGSATGAVGDG